jgi:hypothetical protein
MLTIIQLPILEAGRSSACNLTSASSNAFIINILLFIARELPVYHAHHATGVGFQWNAAARTDLDENIEISCSRPIALWGYNQTWNCKHHVSMINLYQPVFRRQIKILVIGCNSGFLRKAPATPNTGAILYAIGRELAGLMIFPD